jgi:hypothetical protein
MRLQELHQDGQQMLQVFQLRQILLRQILLRSILLWAILIHPTLILLRMGLLHREQRLLQMHWLWLLLYKATRHQPGLRSILSPPTLP